MKNADERFSIENQQINIFIASSSEAKDIAYGVKSYFPEDSYYVEVWDRAFRVGKSNMENLKEITVIYDYAIIVLTTDDLVKHRDYHDGSVPPNIMFEAGLFYGRIGENKTFFVVEDAVLGFIDKVFSDFKGISLEETFTKKPNAEASVIVKEVANSIKTKINSHFLGSADVGFLPSAALAIGYFENFVSPVMEALYDLRNNEIDHELLLIKKVGRKEEVFAVPFFKKDFKMKIITPSSILDTSHGSLKGKLVDNNLDNTTIKTKTRPFGVYWEKQTIQDIETNGFVFHDFPTTLFSAKKVIDMFLTSGGSMNKDDAKTKQLVGEKEIFTFIKALRFKIDTSEKYYIRNHIEIIAGSKDVS